MVGLFLFFFNNQNINNKTTISEDFVGEARRPIPIINARAASSCDADKNCEMNAATIGSLEIAPTNTGPRIASLEYNTLEIVSSLGIQIQAPVIQMIGTMRGSALVADEVVSGTLTINKATRFASLSGKGNAFACLDYLGNLYRSDVPCNKGIIGPTPPPVY